MQCMGPHILYLHIRFAAMQEHIDKNQALATDGTPGDTTQEQALAAQEVKPTGGCLAVPLLSTSLSLDQCSRL